ncbi:hypothetical protein BJX61DRAFT_184466 [Aspergillus egyptiacus]|nr:hypothetical protein BJX61DRAFT_184466 [Aspergillus egyptiacus]
MGVGEFQRAIGATGKPHYDFMKQNGKMKGQFSSVYGNAHRFFHKREILGVKGRRAAAGKNAGGRKMTKEEEEAKYDVSGVILPGEYELDGPGHVPVYETCDEVRRKINVFLRESGMSRAAFSREISKAARMESSIQGGLLARFLAQSGPDKGKPSSVFYAAYVFFEKLRVRDGKPKSPFREEMEAVWGAGGFDIKSHPGKGYIVTAGSSVYVDRYGRVRCAPGRV